MCANKRSRHLVLTQSDQLRHPTNFLFSFISLRLLFISLSIFFYKKFIYWYIKGSLTSVVGNISSFWCILLPSLSLSLSLQGNLDLLLLLFNDFVLSGKHQVLGSGDVTSNAYFVSRYSAQRYIAAKYLDDVCYLYWISQRYSPVTASAVLSI